MDLDAMIVAACITECDRAVRQALGNTEAGRRAFDGELFETCFAVVLAPLLARVRAEASEKAIREAAEVCGKVAREHREKVRQMAERVGKLLKVRRCRDGRLDRAPFAKGADYCAEQVLALLPKEGGG